MNKEQKNIQDRTFSARLHRFMEEHAPWFWCIFILVVVVIVYKAFNLAFLGKTPYKWDDAFQHIFISLLCILLMRETYKGQFHLGFQTSNFWQGVLLCWPVFLICVLNLSINFSTGRVYGDSLLMTALLYFSVGLFEEVVMRGILVGHMLHHWKNDSRRIFKTVLWSSVIFGVTHLGNVFSNPIGTAFQIVYATGLGMVFAAAYIRTRNLWSCILIHSIVDFTGGIEAIYVPLQADSAAYQASCNQITNLGSLWIPEEMAYTAALMFQFAAVAVAFIAAGIACYMLRSKKRSSIDALWKKL